MNSFLKYSFVFLISIVCQLSSYSQEPKLDSLKNAYTSAKNEKEKTRLGLDLIWIYRMKGMVNEGISLGKQLLRVSEKNNWRSLSANGYNKMAHLYNDISSYDTASYYGKKALALHLELKEEESLINDYGVLGDVHYFQSQYIVALEYYLKGLPLTEKYKDHKGLTTAYNNIANIYKDMSNYSRSYEYRMKSMEIHKKDKNNYGIAIMQTNVAYDLLNMQDSVLEKIRYSKRQRDDTILTFFRSAYKTFEKINFPEGKAAVLGNLGLFMNTIGRYDTALVCEQRSYEIYKELGSKLDMAGSLGDIAVVYLKMKNYRQSIASGLEARALAEETGNRFALTEIYKNLYLAYKATHQADKTIFYLEQWKIMSDSMNGEAEQRALTTKSLQYEFGKKAAADSVKNEEEKKVKNAEIKAQQIQLKQEKTQRYFLFGGLGLLIVFGAFMYNRFKVTQKQKDIISAQKKTVERQKELVEEHQKEILDSIYYARRIQQALLPRENYIHKTLKKLTNEN